MAAGALGGCGSYSFAPIEEDDRVDGGGSTITLAFAGDVHFTGAPLRRVLADDDSTLGPMSPTLESADLAMVNLETAVTTRGQRAGKELESREDRYWFRAADTAFDVLDRSGVDVVSMANNHAADYGVVGVRDALASADGRAPAVVGLGLDAERAFAPHRTSVRGQGVSVHAADASFLESDDPVWSAQPGSGPGIARDADALAEAVESSAARDDLVVVYLHWGEEGRPCPTRGQRGLAERLAEAGADVVVGSHTHVPMGAGRLGSTYVAYGLGDFHWYHGRNADYTGVLQLSVRDGQVVGDEWQPAKIPEAGGGPRRLSGSAAQKAVTDWRELRECTGLDPVAADDSGVDSAPEDLPDFQATVQRIGPALRERMTSHDEAVCPVSLDDLRYVTLTYVGFDGRARRGEIVVAADVANDVIDVFERLYRERFAINSMVLLDDFDGDDDRSMAANNTSGYNCRRVAGSDDWSNHSFGRAIDINPVQNPYVVDGVARPPASAKFARVDRSRGADAAAGVIVEGDVVTQEFARIGWRWGASFGDYQHFDDPPE